MERTDHVVGRVAAVDDPDRGGRLAGSHRIEVGELAGRLADVTGDDTYTRVLGDRDITSY